ncbi:protein-glutamate methylesterase/protein-glutamine glutaminase [Pacificimonas flava]|nr:chemotaxis response regulator protein-glutamate methylesterase [Pacificimonas flava]MBB5280087.1 two-component system chemotaxis response regulator CheB [Pacificimonas flava]
MTFGVMPTEPFPAAGPPDPRPADRPIRVMLVDDSGVTRALFERWLREAGIDIVAAAKNGEEARELIASCNPDIVILDIEMPKLGGLDVLPELLALSPGVRILMASTLSRRGARITMDALKMGAADALAKPDSGWASSQAQGFRADFLRRIEALGRRAPAGRSLRPAQRAAQAPQRIGNALRYSPGPRPAIVVIGASTGGPNALFTLLANLPSQLAAPIVITQHMPPTFTAVFAEHLARTSGHPAREAGDNEVLESGHIYVAPGGRHLEVRRTRNDKAVSILTDAPPENFCRPSVNPLFRSAAAWGQHALAIVLTGMGSDGLEGARELKAAGARLYVQDARTSTVWGMPGSIARAGLSDAVLPLSALSRLIRTELAA